MALNINQIANINRRNNNKGFQKRVEIWMIGSSENISSSSIKSKRMTHTQDDECFFFFLAKLP